MAQAATCRGVDGAIRTQAEEHGAFETMALAKDLAEHGHGLLAAVFFVARQEHDVLAFGRTSGFINNVVGGAQTGRDKERKEKLFHEIGVELAENETYAK